MGALMQARANALMTFSEPIELALEDIKPLDDDRIKLDFENDDHSIKLEDVEDAEEVRKKIEATLTQSKNSKMAYGTKESRLRTEGEKLKMEEKERKSKKNKKKGTNNDLSCSDLSSISGKENKKKKKKKKGNDSSSSSEKRKMKKKSDSSSTSSS